MKILYFTATGNCLHVAKRLGGELLSIPQLQKSGTYEITDDAVGIVCPIYGMSVPGLVRRYLEKATIRAEYVFAVMTFGSFSLATLARMKELLGERGIPLHYSNEIEMVDNFLPFFEMSAQLKKNKDKGIELKIDGIANDIRERRHSLVRHCWLKKCLSGMSSAFMKADSMGKMAKNFTVNDSCNACGTCRKVCPAGNITGTGKPEYNGNCEFCLACIHLCPANAIHLKNERSGKRFINPHVGLSEIISANRQ